MAKELVHKIFSRRASEFPNRTGVSILDRSISYQELDHSSNRLSHLLLSLGFTPQTVAATLMPSGIELISTVIAIFKAAGVYMPMDKSYSDRRIAQMLQQSQARLLIISAEMRVYVEGLLETCEHHIEHLIVFPRAVSALVEGLKVEGLDLMASPGAGLEVFRLNGKDYQPLALSLSDQATDDPAIEANLEGAAYIYYTSGSSGRSKGIQGRYDSLSHYVQWHAQEWGLDSQSRVAQFCSPGFDAWLKDVWPSLISGASLCIAPPQVRANPALLGSWLSSAGITHFQTVPSIFRLLTASLQTENHKLKALKLVILAGEPLYGQDVLNWIEIQGDHTELANMYGLTETTILKSFYRIGSPSWDGGAVIPVGRPISNTQIAVINEGGMCLHGEVGEVYIKSPYISLGYLDEGLNETLFVQNPLSTGEDIICRTGDLGRYNSLGELEILGRKDEQVKIHGVRIELAEVRSALYELTGIERVELLVHQGADNNRELLCYYSGEQQPASKLKSALAELLPASYLPAYFLWLDHFPLTLNGKVDRKKLPRPEAVLASESFEPPAGEMEVGLARLWSQVLAREEIGRQDSFFNLGGSSLKVIQLIARIYKQYEVQLSIGDIFDHPILADQAKLIKASRFSAYQPIEQIAVQESYPLSHAQQRLWFVHQLNPNQIAYNVPQVVRLEGHLDKDRLHFAFSQLIDRHEILRTSFRLKGEAVVQYVSKEVEFKIEHHHSDEAQIPSIIDEFIRPFDLSRDSLFRVGLIESIQPIICSW